MGWCRLVAKGGGTFTNIFSLESSTSSAANAVQLSFNNSGVSFFAMSTFPTEYGFVRQPRVGDKFFWCLQGRGTGTSDLRAFWMLEGERTLQAVSGTGKSFTSGALFLGNGSYNDWSNTRHANFKLYSSGLLTPAEIMAEMLSPTPIRSGQLKCWAPLESNTSLNDYATGNPLTATGTTVNGQSPTLYRPLRSSLYRLPLSDGGGAVVLPPLTWLASYPDSAPGVPKANPGPATAYSPATDRWGLDSGQSPWRGVFPERAPGPQQSNAGPASAYVPALDRWGVDNGKIPWHVVYPDRVPAAPRPNQGPAFTAGQAIHGVEGAKGWDSEFPDTVPGPRRPNVGPSFAAGQAVHGVEGGGKGWGAQFPDRAPSPARPTEGTVFAAGPARFGVEGGQFGWLGVYPEATPRRAPSLIEFPALAYVPAILRWGLDGMPWLPVFPERVPGALRPNAGPFYAAPVGPPALPIWWPHFPDFARGSARSPEFIATAQALLNFIAAPAPLGSWYPAFPDFARAAAPRQQAGNHQALLNLPTPAPLGSWYPSFPDIARAAARAQNTDPGQLLRTLTAVVSLDQWAPRYPDLIWVPRRPTPVDPAFVNLGAATPPPRGWAATYPDRTAPGVRMPPSEFALPLYPPGFAPPILAWLGRFPDVARGAPPRQTAGAAIPGDPTPRALSWLARYPDRILRPVLNPIPPLVSLIQLVAPPPAAPILAWLARYPDMVRGPIPRHLVAQIVAMEPFFQGVSGAELAEFIGDGASVVVLENSRTVVVLIP